MLEASQNSTIHRHIICPILARTVPGQVTWSKALSQ